MALEWIAAIMVGLAIFAIGAGGILLLSTGQGRVSARVQQYVALDAPPAAPVVTREQRRRRREVVTEIESRRETRGGTRSLATTIARAGLSLTTTEVALLRTGGAVLMAVLFVAAAPGLWWLLIWPGLLIGAWLPLTYIRYRARSRLRRLDQQLPDLLALLSGAVRSGSSLFQALDRIAQESEEPIRSEFLLVVRALSLGAPLETALRTLIARFPSEEIEMLTTAIVIQQQTGGNIGQILDLTAATVRERHRIQREINVLSAQQRLSAYLLAGLPLILMLILFVISPTYIGRMFEPGWALIMPVSMVILLVLGFLVMSRIASIDV